MTLNVHYVTGDSKSDECVQCVESGKRAQGVRGKLVHGGERVGEK